MSNKKKFIHTKDIYSVIKYFLIISLVIIISQLVIWNFISIEKYRTLYIVINAICTILLLIIVLFIVHKKAKKQLRTSPSKEYVRCIFITFSIVMFFLTFFGLGTLWGSITSYQKYGYIIFIAPLFFLSFAGIMWIDSLFRKVIVSQEGLIITRWNLLFPDRFYSFEDIQKIKIKGWFVNIKCKNRFIEPDSLLIFNSKRFIKNIEKYAKEKLQTNRVNI